MLAILVAYSLAGYLHYPEDARVTISTDLGLWDLLSKQLKEPVELVWRAKRPVILVIDSEKGGVGKTALANGLIAVAAAGGLRVWATDLDPRATLTKELGADHSDGFGVNELLYVDPEANPDELPDIRGLASEVLRPAGEEWGPNVQVMAAVRGLAHRETDLTPGLEHRLRLAFEGILEGNVDLVVIDLPPRAGGKLVASGLLAATHVLYTGTLDADGLDGILEARRTYKFITQTSPTPPVQVGVLRNRVGPRTNLAEHFDGRFAEEFGDSVLPFVVPQRVLRLESRGACVPITAANSPDARDLINGYTRVLNAVGGAA